VVFLTSERIVPCKPPGGFTFLEIVAALAVLAIGVVAVITLFPVGLENSKRASERTRAALLVYSELQLYRNRGYQHVLSASGTADTPFRNDPFFIRRLEVTIPTGVTPPIREITVTASWPSTQPDPNRRRTLQMSTLVSER
jgi:uncharacterized protein (TIGR02598 family)